MFELSEVAIEWLEPCVVVKLLRGGTALKHQLDENALCLAVKEGFLCLGDHTPQAYARVFTVSRNLAEYALEFIKRAEHDLALCIVPRQATHHDALHEFALGVCETVVQVRQEHIEVSVSFNPRDGALQPECYRYVDKGMSE